MKAFLIAAAVCIVVACGSGGGASSEPAPTPTPQPVPPPPVPDPTPTPGTKTAYCESIIGGSTVSTTFSQGCLDCDIVDEAKVADDVARSFASLTINDAPPTQGGSIRVTAQSGVVFPAGQEAGAYITIPDQPGGTQVQLLSSNAIAIKTYLAGALQEETSALAEPRVKLQAVSGDPELPESYVSFTTSKVFDAVELFISNSQTTIGTEGVSQTPPYKVYELCSDGGVR